MSELANIRERLKKVVIAAPIEQAGIYAQQRDDLRYLLGVIDMQAKQLDAFLNPKDAA